MEIAALITWLITAAGGLVLLGTWISRGGHRARSGSRLTPPLIFGHVLLAVAGLVVWIIYLVTDTESLTWVAFVLLLPTALLGLTMFARWLGLRREPALGGAGTAESRFPVPVVYGHGLFALTTLVLVLLVAAGVGGD